MRIGIYSPYLNIMGGGERYLLSLASHLRDKGEVCLFSQNDIKDKASELFNIDLSGITFVPSGLLTSPKIITRALYTHQFNLFFFMTDGSLFFSLAGRNFLIIQSPAHMPSDSLINKIKLKNWTILCYSDFMKKIIQKSLGTEPLILSPGIDTDRFKSGAKIKENIILTVGRFFPFPHNKKQDFLIETFKRNMDKLKGWKLVIAGGMTEKGGEEVFADLSKRSVGFPIKIFTNMKFDQLAELYKRSSIYWHAAGFGENLDKYPQKAEHFGITTIEAMASGTVPIVFAGGGQKDIVEEGVTGYFWKDEEELVGKTLNIIKDRQLYDRVSLGGIRRAADFSLERFYEKIDKIIQK